jgi:hypothetical protein
LANFGRDLGDMADGTRGGGSYWPVFFRGLVSINIFPFQLLAFHVEKYLLTALESLRMGLSEHPAEKKLHDNRGLKK